MLELLRKLRHNFAVFSKPVLVLQQKLYWTYCNVDVDYKQAIAYGTIVMVHLVFHTRRVSAVQSSSLLASGHWCACCAVK